nr:asparagine synthetase [glutamine-hydrolyzing] 3 [uncultured bacterium]
MSGIIGVWNLDGAGAPVDPAVLDRMAGTIRHRGPDGEGRYLAGPAGLVHQRMWVTPQEVGERQPLIDSAGAVLVMDGRIDNRAELLRTLRLPPSSTDATCVLAAYAKWDTDLVPRLSGDFALAIFDPARQRLLLARDPMGVRPLFYVRTDRLFAFASEIKALLAHPEIEARPNDDGLADFMLIGSRPLDRQEITCFEGISALVPSHLALVSPGRFTTRRYWDFDVANPLKLGSFDEYAEAFRAHFEEAVRRRARSAHPVAVSVSGGLDSSSIFCQAETLRRRGGTPPRILGISYIGSQGTHADERRYLPDLERAFDATIERIPMEPLLGLVKDAEEQIQAIESPFLDYAWGVSRAVRLAAGAGGARSLLSGHWGDQMLFSSRYLVDLVKAFAWRTAYRHAREWERWFTLGEARSFQRRFWLDLVRDLTPDWLVPPLKWIRRRLFRAQRAKSWFSPAFLRQGLRFANQPALSGSQFHSAQAKSLYVEARSKYHVQCMEWNNQIGARFGLDAAFPFLDRDLIAFLISIPGEIQNRNGVPRALLREAMRGILPETIRARTWKADFSTLVTDGISKDLEHIAGVLSPRSAAARMGYLRADHLGEEIARLTRGLERGNSLDSWDLADMFGLELWLQLFMGQGTEQAPTRPQLEEILR